MGLFSKKKKEEPIDELPPEIQEKLADFCEKGNMLADLGEREAAIQIWQEGLDLIPAPQQFYSETVWFLASIGDMHFQLGQYSKACECFDKARGNMSGAGYSNPFVMLRLGECCLELGDEKNALEYLLRAYMMEGEEIFQPDENGEDDGSKYFEFLRTHIDLNQGER